MARILLAIDFELEANLLEGILVGGHEVVDRVTGADALSEAVTRMRPDIVIAQGGPETLTSRSLATCDAAGARIVVLMAGDTERRNTLSLGIVDRVDASAEWGEIERLITASPQQEQAPSPADSSYPIKALAASSAPDLQSRRARKARERGTRAARGGATGPVSAPVGQDAVPRSARVIAVWGPHGAPGRTTVAVALAATLAAAGQRVLLIDADPYGGAIAPLLGISEESPGLAAACRLAGADSLDHSEFERVVAETRTPGTRFRVLTGIVNPARWPELGRQRMRGVIARARAEAEVVIIDVGFSLERDEELLSDMAAPRRNAATHTALEESDVIVALADATPVGLQRHLRARLQLVECVSAGCRIETVANRVRGAVGGLDSSTQIRQVLHRFGGVENVSLLPNDPKAADRALAEGLAVVDAAPRSALSKQIRTLASALMAETTRTPVRVS